MEELKWPNNLFLMMKHGAPILRGVEQLSRAVVTLGQKGVVVLDKNLGHLPLPKTVSRLLKKLS